MKVVFKIYFILYEEVCTVYSFYFYFDGIFAQVCALAM
jgi:hypothetical protein